MAMQIDDLLDLMRKRRSYRKFKPDPVSGEQVEKILEAGRWAQSGANAQPWEYIVVRSQETKDKLAERWVPSRLHAFDIEQIRRPDMIHHALHQPQTTPPGSWKDAPVLIVVCGDRRTLMATVLYTNFITSEGGAGAIYIKNMATTVQNMHLAAAAQGLGSQWLSVDYVFEQDVRAILGIPSVLEIHSMVAVGYPAYELGEGYRRELDEIVHDERYDMSKYRSDEDVIEFVMKMSSMRM
jgi:5,6-dimethylbenzimidazole synthase